MDLLYYVLTWLLVLKINEIQLILDFVDLLIHLELKATCILSFVFLLLLIAGDVSNYWMHICN